MLEVDISGYLLIQFDFALRTYYWIILALNEHKFRGRWVGESACVRRERLDVWSAVNITNCFVVFVVVYGPTVACSPGGLNLESKVLGSFNILCWELQYLWLIRRFIHLWMASLLNDVRTSTGPQTRGWGPPPRFRALTFNNANWTSYPSWYLKTNTITFMYYIYEIK